MVTLIFTCAFIICVQWLALVGCRCSRVRVLVAFRMVALCSFLVILNVVGIWALTQADIKDQAGIVRHLSERMKTGLGRAITYQVARYLFVVASRLVLLYWPVQSALEQFSRCLSTAVAPYHLLGVTSCCTNEDAAAFFATDWGVFVFKAFFRLLCDHIDRRLAARKDRVSFVATTLSQLQQTLLQIVTPRAPKEWHEVGVEGHALWARFVLINDMVATSGIAAGCVIMCAIFFVVEDNELNHPYVVQGYTPAGATSMFYMVLLVISELLQDWLLHMLLIRERCMPQRARMLSDSGRAFLDAKVKPPILASRRQFAQFVLPLFASTCMTTGFCFAPALMVMEDQTSDAIRGHVCRQ